MDYTTKDDLIEYIFSEIKSFILPSESNSYKSRFLQSNVLLYCVVLLLTLRIFAALISINIPQNIFFADITKFSLENLVNQTRQSLQLQPLTENEKLDQAARFKAENMIQDQYFNHVSPTGITPWFWFLKAGYNYKYAGENLAVGFYDSKEVYDAWLNSPSHKANILNPNYTDVGTAVLSGFGQSNSIVVVQEFASPSKTQLTAPLTASNSQIPKALSQSTASQNYLSLANPKGTNSSYSKVLNYVTYNYNDLLQDVVYGVSLVVIGILLTLIFFNFHIDFKKELILRAVIVVLLLSAATLINKAMIVSVIPHQVRI